jgi:hypothetical protein
VRGLVLLLLLLPGCAQGPPEPAPELEIVDFPYGELDGNKVSWHATVVNKSGNRSPITLEASVSYRGMPAERVTVKVPPLAAGASYDATFTTTYSGFGDYVGRLEAKQGSFVRSSWLFFESCPAC